MDGLEVGLGGRWGVVLHPVEVAGVWSIGKVERGGEVTPWACPPLLKILGVVTHFHLVSCEAIFLEL